MRKGPLALVCCNVFADVLYVHARAHDYINFIELDKLGWGKIGTPNGPS